MSSTVASAPPVGGPKTNKIEIRVDDEWLALANEASDRKGLGLSAYIRMVVLERMQQDSITIPEDKNGKHKKK